MSTRPVAPERGRAGPRLDDLRAAPNALARHYSAFRVGERLLLTGHSHQAWPDVGFEAQKQAWLDAAEHADGKWGAVADKTAAVCAGYRRLIGDCDGDLTLDSNTHALVVRFLSALPLRDRPRVVTTDGEFHSIRRQLDRLAEEGLEVVEVDPLDSLAERVANAVDDRTACAVISSVLFATGAIVPNLPRVAEACTKHGAELLVDTYHSLGVVPFTPDGMERAFMVGGGYKYCQLGEGNCVLRVPPDCTLRPAITGWFSEFGELAEARDGVEVRYGAGPARFAGSTFDPTSHYRGAAVFDFFADQGLTVDFLREVSQHQVRLLAETFTALDLDPAVARLDPSLALERRGGFLSIRAAGADQLQAALLERGVRTDARGSILRLGPAPYHTDAQLEAAMGILGEIVG